jgi:DNA-dependent RNA polymerase auxiliary subunit epsilon
MKIFESKIKDSVLLPFLEKTGILYIEITEQTTIQRLIETNKVDDFSEFTVSEMIEMFPEPNNVLYFLETIVIPDNFCEVCGCHPCECSEQNCIDIELTKRQLNDQFYIKN